MLHARDDYNRRIQDNAGKIPDNEPVFMIRAQDKHAIPILTAYLVLVEQDNGDSSIIEGVRKQLRRMQVWQNEYGHKAPDMEPVDIV